MTGFQRSVIFVSMITFVARHKTVGSFRRVDIVRFIHKKGECTVSEIALHERFSLASASYHLHKLQREGMVCSRREGRNTHYRLTGKLCASELFQQMLKSK